jgi:hypothetical protein
MREKGKEKAKEEGRQMFIYHPFYQVESIEKTGFTVEIMTEIHIISVLHCKKKD